MNIGILHFAILAASVMLAGCAGEKPVKTSFSASEKENAALELVSRVTNGRENSFKVVVTGKQEQGKDYYSYYSSDGKIALEGTDGVGVASALNAYLKSCCGWSYSWCGSDTALPAVLPRPAETVRRTSPYKYRYYLNYCTFNYTMSWWDDARWQKEIDWMALNGINMPLSLTGQNSVWKRVYNRLGFTDAELESFFSGPAYYNWFWMGNLDGWEGPLPQSIMKKQEEMQKRILLQERSLGMTPVLPAFTGHVPPAFASRYPDAKLRKTSWVNFPEVSILDPGEEMFSTIGRMFIEEQTALYGTNHYYSADTFNENLPPSSDSLFLAGMSEKVYNSMAAVDSEAVWVMQGWLFYHERNFWGEPEIKALLNSVPDDNMIILDLWSERFPVWKRTEAYYGKPWIWCMLHNFGQNSTLSGNATPVATEPAAALRDPAAGQMQGVGLTMEGIEQNPAMYALMLENVWRDTPIDIDSFIDSYFSNRYGSADSAASQAWKIIFSKVFENESNNGGPESIITARPSFKSNPGGTTNLNRQYDPSDLVAAWKLLLSSADSLGGSDGYRYDLVDITRQVLADYASVVQGRASDAFAAGDIDSFSDASDVFLELVGDMDLLLSSRREFLLGPWLESAKNLGDTDSEKALYEQNARNLVTLWGDRDCRIHDYACRHWSGLMNGFYRERWQLFFESAKTALKASDGASSPEFDQKAFDEKCKDFEWTWVTSRESYSTEPSGNEIGKCKYICSKYFGGTR